MASKISKNARSGPKQAQRIPQCAAGHPLVPVMVAGRGMRRVCACSGYAPIDATRPYAQIKAPEAIGKACLPRKGPGCVPQGRS